VRALLTEHQLSLKAGTIVDATIIAAPSSTMSETQTRDPSMKQTRKGNQWYFGMQVHVGSDKRGIVNTVTTTDAATADITQLDDVLHGQERTLFGDQAGGVQ
jgi:transposase, IS5 family